MIAPFSRPQAALQGGFIHRYPFLARFAWGAANDILEFFKFNEVIRLAAQVIGDHWRLTANGRHHRNPATTALKGFDQSAKIAVARE